MEPPLKEHEIPLLEVHAVTSTLSESLPNWKKYNKAPIKTLLRILKMLCTMFGQNVRTNAPRLKRVLEYSERQWTPPRDI